MFACEGGLYKSSSRDETTKLILAIAWFHGFSLYGRVYYIFVLDVTVRRIISIYIPPSKFLIPSLTKLSNVDQISANQAVIKCYRASEEE